MKKIVYSFSILILALFAYNASAQNKGINYQAVISDPNPIEIAGKSITGQPLVNANVCIKFEIINQSGSVDYTETHATQTDDFGLVNLIIGVGKNTSSSTVTVGSGTYSNFELIKWDENTKSVRVSLSLANCSNFKVIANQIFNYLPYAFYAGYAGGVDYKNVTGAPTKLSAFLNDSGYLLPVDLDPLKANLVLLDTKIQNNFNITNQSIKSVKYSIDSSNAGIKVKIDELYGNVYNLSNHLNEHKNYIDNLFASIGQINNSLNQLNNSIYQLNQSGSSYERLANKSTNISTDATSDTKYPSVRAVKSYVDGQLNSVTIPDASTTSRGAVNTGQQSFAGNKTFTGNIFFDGLATIANASISSSADLLGPLFLRGSAGTAGQILTSNGSGSAPSWTSLVSVGGATFTVAAPLVYANSTLSIPAADENNNGYLSNSNQTIGGTKNFNNDVIVSGIRLGKGNSSGTLNLALGGGWVNTTGRSNTWVGAGAATIQQSGDYNTVLGTYGMSYLTSGSNNIAIGSYQNVGPFSGHTNNNALNIGGLIFGTGMNGYWDRPAGFLGIGKTDPSVRLDVAGSIKASDTLTASTIIKSGGTENQILAANGSVITAGTGVTISNGVISSTGTNNNVTVTDATSSNKGIIQLAGDLAGTATAPTVPGLALKLNKADTAIIISKLEKKLNVSDTTALAARFVRLTGGQTIAGVKSFSDTVKLKTTNLLGKLLLGGAAGTAGQVLSVNASGDLVWNTPVTNSGGGTSSITTVSAPLALSSGTLSISQATASSSGYLTSSDWTNFNNKADTAVIISKLEKKLNVSDTTALAGKFVRLSGNQTIAGRKTFSGTVDLTGSLVLNGTAGTSGQLLSVDASGNLVWTTPVTSGGGGSSNISSVTSPLALSSGTLSIAQASDSNAGYLSSADFTTFKNKLSATDTLSLSKRIDARELLSNKSTDVNLGSSDTLYPSQKAVKTYVDNAVAIPDASTAVRGLINTGGQVFEGNKQFDSGIIVKGSGAQASALGSNIIPLLVLGEGRNPTKIFEIQNNTHVAAVINTNTNSVSFAGLQLQRVGSGQWDIGINGNNRIINGILTHRNDLVFNSIGGHVVGINGFTGNMGIGNNNPQQKLDVSGGIRFEGPLSIGDTVGTAGQALVSQGPGLAPRWKTIQASFDTTSLISRIDKKLNAADTTIWDSRINLRELISNKSNNFIADSASTTKYPSVKAVKDFVKSETVRFNQVDGTNKQFRMGDGSILAGGNTLQLLSFEYLTQAPTYIDITTGPRDVGQYTSITGISIPTKGYVDGLVAEVSNNVISLDNQVTSINSIINTLGNTTIPSIQTSFDLKLPASDTTKIYAKLDTKLNITDTTALANRFVRLTTNQTISGNKTFSDTISLGTTNITGKLLLGGAAGTNGQVLSVNSSGNLVWTTPVTNSGGGNSSITSVSTPLDLSNGVLSIAQATASTSGYLTASEWTEFKNKAPLESPTFTGTVSGITAAMVGLSNVDNTSDANKPISAATQTALNAKANLASPTFTGTVSGITAAMVGLGNVNNTSDANKPVSTATQAALDLKAPLASPTFTGTVSGITAAMVGLGNVNNTSDANKPISTATQTALNAKANLASPTFTGTVSGITAAMVGLGNVDNTSDINKPVSTATQAALDLKAPLASPTLTGIPTAPTAASGTNTTQIATTAFVQTAISGLSSAGNSVLDATTSVKGIIQLAGDLGNTATTPRVVALQGTSLSSTAPSTNQILRYNGTAWAPANAPRLETDEYTATAGQTTFTLTNTPSGRVQAFRNGVRLPKNSVSVSGLTLTYVPANNNNDALIAGDTITIDYLF